MSLERSILKLASVAQVLSSIDTGLTCTTPGCNKSVSKTGYKLCYDCWKANKAQFTPTPKPQPQSPSVQSLLSATSISEKLAIPKNKVNVVLAELGLLSKDQNGWVATKRGVAFGAVQKTHP